MENNDNKNEKILDEKPKVVLFGQNIGGKDSNDKDSSEQRKVWKEEWYGRHDHYRRCGGGVFGLLAVMVGVILVLNNTGAVPWQFWDYVLPFWPALLVILGAQIIIGQSIFARIIVFLLAAIIFSFITIYGFRKVESPIMNDLPPGFLGVYL